jgi:hypothetical protein
VAGVQEAARQHWPVLFFQTSPDALRQLSMVCAPAVPAITAAANKVATLFKFFMVLLWGDKKPQRCCERLLDGPGANHPKRFTYCATDTLHGKLLASQASCPSPKPVHLRKHRGK